MFTILIASVVAFQPSAGCARDSWPPQMALTRLTNARMIDPKTINLKHASTRLIVGKKVSGGKITEGVWRRVYYVTLPIKSGGRWEAIVVSDASYQQCLQSTPQVYLVTRAT